MEDIRIMLVANDGVLIELIKFFLRNTGIKLSVCREFGQASEDIRQTRPDIVYLSAGMDGDCVECLKAITQQDDTRHIPVVVIPARTHDEYLQLCRDSGCAYILTKPVDRRAFLSSVRSFVNPEKRDNARFEARLEVSYGLDAPDSLSAHSVNISRGGVFVHTCQALPADTILRLRIVLPNVSSPIETSARVAWVNRLGAPVKAALPPGMALEFIDLTPEDTDHICRYIHDEHIAKLLKCKR